MIFALPKSVIFTRMSSSSRMLRLGAFSARRHIGDRWNPLFRLDIAGIAGCLSDQLAS